MVESTTIRWTNASASPTAANRAQFTDAVRRLVPIAKAVQGGDREALTDLTRIAQGLDQTAAALGLAALTPVIARIRREPRMAWEASKELLFQLNNPLSRPAMHEDGTPRTVFR